MISKIEMQAMDAVIGIHREMRKANEIDWEQRRYEIATSTPALAFRLLLRVAVPPTAMFAVVFPAAASAVRVCRVQVQKIDFDGAFLRSQGFQVIEHNLSSFLS